MLTSSLAGCGFLARGRRVTHQELIALAVAQAIRGSAGDSAVPRNVAALSASPGRRTSPSNTWSALAGQTACSSPAKGGGGGGIRPWFGHPRESLGARGRPCSNRGGPRPCPGWSGPARTGPPSSLELSRGRCAYALMALVVPGLPPGSHFPSGASAAWPSRRDALDGPGRADGGVMDDATPACSGASGLQHPLSLRGTRRSVQSTHGTRPSARDRVRRRPREGPAVANHNDAR